MKKLFFGFTLFLSSVLNAQKDSISGPIVQDQLRELYVELQMEMFPASKEFLMQRRQWVNIAGGRHNL